MPVLLRVENLPCGAVDGIVVTLFLCRALYVVFLPWRRCTYTRSYYLIIPIQVIVRLRTVYSHPSVRLCSTVTQTTKTNHERRQSQMRGGERTRRANMGGSIDKKTTFLNARRARAGWKGFATSMRRTSDSASERQKLASSLRHEAPRCTP